MTANAFLSPDLHHLFKAVPDLYLLISPDFTILTASDPYLKATMKELESIQGKSLFDVFPDNTFLAGFNPSANLRKSLEWVLEHKKPHKNPLQRYDIPQHTLPNSFKEKYWRTSNTPVLDEEGNILYIIHKVVDVTKRVMDLKREESSKKQASELQGRQQLKSEALDEARAQADLERRKLHNLLMQAPAMICIYEGPQHTFSFVNPPYQQLVGKRPLLGKPIAEAMPELEGQAVFGLLDQVYRTGETFYAHEMKVQLDHDNSGALGENYYNFIYQATYNLDGQIDGIMTFAYEVTAQVVARREVEDREKALRALNLQLSEANREIQTSNQELSQTQLAMRQLNQELEARVAERTQELQRSKAETENERNRLHKLFMRAPAPICIMAGEDLVYELVNPAYQELFPGRKLLGNSLLGEALVELASQPVAQLFRHVYATGETGEKKEEMIAVARHEGGPLEERYFNYTIQARLNEANKPDGVIVFAYEVTAQVEARQAIEQSAEKLQLITDALPVLIGYLDKDEKYSFANKAYEAWFPMKSTDLLGRTVLEVIGEKAYQGVEEYIKRALAGERLDFESRMPYREGFTKYIRTSYVPDIREGNVAGFYTLVNDVTEQVEIRLEIEEREKEAQALTRELAATNNELSTANEQLKRINADLDNFIYTASHDLKAPIFNIEGLLQILIESIPDETLASNQLNRVVRMIGDSIGRFKRTIQHLTEVIKLQKESGEEEVLVDVQQVIQGVRLDLSTQLNAVGAKVETDLADCPDIRFSEKNLRSVVFNLLSNAIKYSSPERRLDVSIKCYREGDFVVLSVQDNGLGMELTGTKKLFAMFGRLHDHVEGSGIGLYMVKKIVENAEGRIEVDSQLGAGSTFRVYLKR
ncbi:PAS domain-containing protein [Pontibacter sp. E15-1]|uniref:PAS domain-containing sensor histidine kinase n=1 Tax=Pontibacter sp. E15-1 TaxID=2919918 RepID=UPI001F4F3001|nr:PAS domain-containing protein [Pontibacter sp. E15-1]MCJ8164166.1 PAS domain-containing protein [Pontibacter sp. E15-1]